MQPFDFLEKLKNRPGYAGQIVHVEDLPAVEGRFAEPKAPLPEELNQRLAEMGVANLFTHQAAALDAVREKKNIAVVTSTASGKTLCYNLPVIERLLANHSASALYLFPTKALAQDQCGKLAQFNLPSRLSFGTYDGDTSNTDRSHLRSNGRIILSNVDMLHSGILPRHSYWGRFFRRLEFVVLDEMHCYRGVFGSHVGCILRRLKRICRHHGSDPVFIFCSATIANPGELAKSLAGVDFDIIDDDGAPKGPRKFVFWNPPVIGNDGARKSAHSEATSLFTSLVEENIRNITFTKARRSAELILKYAREHFRQSHEATLSNRVMSYRAGYTAKERRDIEQKLFQGAITGVVATEALELGMDVGGLDATVLTGFPGTISSAWQQAGRAGRSTGQAISIMIGLPDPLDQYLMNHPNYFFGKGTEQVLINPANPYILSSHIACAAHEIPVSKEELTEFGENTLELAWTMAAEDLLSFKDGKFYWLPEVYPAGRVSIRSADSNLYRIVKTTGETLGEIEESRAFEETHEGAIYMHAGETYRVIKLDMFAREAIVERGNFPYYTRATQDTSLRIVSQDESYPLGKVKTYFGKVEVTNQVITFKKIELFTETILGMDNLDLPANVYETEGFWFTIGHELVRKVQDDGYDFMGSIHAIEHAAIGLTPLIASCDRWDVGGISHPYHLDTGGVAAIFIYDGYPGGVGIARHCYNKLKMLLTDTLELLTQCPCESGCPSCVQSPKCGNNNEPLDKAGATRLLGLILTDE